MQVELKILKKGDQVLNTWDNKISIKRQNGEVEIFTIIEDDNNNLPRISPSSILITYGNNKQVTVRKGNVKADQNDDSTNDDFEIGTF